MQVYSRGRGDSAVARIAYVARARMWDQRYGRWRDRRREGKLWGEEIVAPAGSPAWAFERDQIGNAIEAAERRKDAGLLRELVAACPAELHLDARLKLGRKFAEVLMNRYSALVYIAGHPSRPGSDSRNQHIHFLLSDRVITADGFGRKIRELSRNGREVKWIRQQWIQCTRKVLLEFGYKRAALSFGGPRDQDLPHEPHAGPVATAMHRRGIHTRVWEDIENHRRRVRAYYRTMRWLRWCSARIEEINTLVRIQGLADLRNLAAAQTRAWSPALRTTSVPPVPRKDDASASMSTERSSKPPADNASPAKHRRSPRP